MNSDPLSLDSFEEALLADLRDEVSRRAATHGAAVIDDVTIAPTPSAGSAARRMWALTLASVAAAAVAVAVWVVAPTPTAAPAYAVAASPDGSVTVTIERFEDAAGLQAALRQHGISAVVDFLPRGMVCRDEGRYTSASSDQRGRLSTSIEGSRLTFSIPRNWLGPQETLVISLGTAPPVGDRQDLFAMGFGVADGPVGPCDLIPLAQEVVETDR